MAAMRPENVAKKHYVVALNIANFIIVVYDVKIYMLIIHTALHCIKFTS